MVIYNSRKKEFFCLSINFCVDVMYAMSTIDFSFVYICWVEFWTRINITIGMEPWIKTVPLSLSLKIIFMTLGTSFSYYIGVYIGAPSLVIKWHTFTLAFDHCSRFAGCFKFKSWHFFTIIKIRCLKIQLCHSCGRGFC